MGSAPPSPARTQKAVKSRHAEHPKNAEQARTRPSAAQGRQCRRDRHIKRAGAAGSRRRAGAAGGGPGLAWVGWVRPGAGAASRRAVAARWEGREGVRAPRELRAPVVAVMAYGRWCTERQAGPGRGSSAAGRVTAGGWTTRSVRALPPGQRLAADRGRSTRPPRLPSR